MREGETVWVLDTQFGLSWTLGTLLQISGEKFIVRITENGQEITVKDDGILDWNEECQFFFPNMVSMNDLNEASMLHNIFLRYQNDLIYVNKKKKKYYPTYIFLFSKIKTFIGNMIVSVNPYKQIPDLYSTERMQSYFQLRRSDSNNPEPHIYSLTNQAYLQLIENRQSQSFLIK